MRASVVLCAYQGDRWLAPCLASLASASSRRLHLVLVDNGLNSVVNDLDLRAFEAEVLRTDDPLGFAEANNFALRNASRLQEVVIFLNQDTVSAPGWIDACLDSLDADPKLGAVSPLLRTYDDQNWDPGFLMCLEGVAPESMAVLDRVHRTARITGTAMVVRSETLARVGPFDPIFGSYYEDYDLCRRIRAGGWSVGIAVHARVLHSSGSATVEAAAWRRRSSQILRNRLIERVRDAEMAPWRVLARQVMLDLPRRLGRGWRRKPLEHHLDPRVTLRAYLDLVPILPRLISRGRDRAVWRRYLEEIGWPPTSLRQTARKGQPIA